MDADKSYPMEEDDYVAPIHPPMAPPHTESLQAMEERKQQRNK